MVKIKDEFKDRRNISPNEKGRSIIFPSNKESIHGTRKFTFVHGTKEAPPQLSSQQTLSLDNFDIGYPGSYAHEVIKTVLSQQSDIADSDITEQILLSKEKKEITTKLLLPLPDPLLTILHHCLPLLLVIQLAAFIGILMNMQVDDYWLRGWTIHAVSVQRGWINASGEANSPFFRFVPILEEHEGLRNHLWYAWNIMIILYLPVAVIHMSFILEQKNDE